MTNEKKQNPLSHLVDHGQSVWLDFIRRDFILDGSLKKLVDDDDIRGVTSNPSIFERAIGHGAEYEADIRDLLSKASLSAGELYEHLAVEDIRKACDVLMPVFEITGKRDGYVSFEVSPYIAYNSEETLREVRRLWALVDRDNLMIKVPGTQEAIDVVKQATSEGININVTLLFSLERYKSILEAYVSGLEQRAAQGDSLENIASVASFFISRIDTKVDAEIDHCVSAGKPHADNLKKLRGKVSISNAKLAYQHYLKIVHSERWKKLEIKGAQTQRLLWASTSTKDRHYHDVLYVEELIGDETVNTLPLITIDAFRDHGTVQSSLSEGIDEACQVMASIERYGVNLSEITELLLSEGCRAFCYAFDALLGAVAARREAVLGDNLLMLSNILPDELASAVVAAEKEWNSEGKIRRLWQRDSSVWTNGSESKWLGWLTAVEDGLANIDAYNRLAHDVKKHGYRHILLLGMGGSSLGPEVLAKTFGQTNGEPILHVLDSTDPQQVATYSKAIDLNSTLFIVSSKSGSTLEPNILFAYFWELAKQALGCEPGEHFVAVTDPGSAMEKVAKDHSFSHIFYGNSEIGGRYSVLSPFGLAPAAAAGYDITSFLKTTQLMVTSCDATVPSIVNTGVQLGLALGVAATSFGRDKVTFVASKEISSLGAWLEQLLAESTGKNGIGLIPIDEETLGEPSVYGKDRVFVELRLGHDPADSRLKALREAGHPVLGLHLQNREQIGQVFFAFEFATAVAGSILGIDPFDQPDVEFSKVETRKLTEAYAETGHLPEEAPFASDGCLTFYADHKNAASLGKGDAASILGAHFGRVEVGDYIGLLAYIERNESHIEWEQELRLMLRDRLHVATASQFGPRFLHSTGQAYKGGPNSGVFLQITAEDAADLAIPHQDYTFGVVKAAQARGDFGVLASRGRRALRVHIKGPLSEGLERLAEVLSDVVKGA